MASLYENIKARRVELQISQEQLAKMTGYSDRTSISKIEAGKVDLSQSKIRLFANALQTTPAELMGWEDYANSMFTMPDSIAKDHFARNLLAVMHTNKIQQPELAQMLGVEQATVSGWCSGLTFPKMEQLTKLSGIFGLSPSYFFTLTPPEVVKRTETPDLVQEFLQLDDSDQKDVRRYIRFLLSAEKYQQQQEEVPLRTESEESEILNLAGNPKYLKQKAPLTIAARGGDVMDTSQIDIEALKRGLKKLDAEDNL